MPDILNTPLLGTAGGGRQLIGADSTAAIDSAEPLFTPAFPRVLDYTMLSAWKSCPHKFFRTHVLGMTKPRRNIHLHFGACVARGLEVARRYYLRTADTGDALEEACLAVVEMWGADFDDFIPTTRTERNKTLSNCLLAIQAYFREWPLDEDELRIHTHADEPCVEFSFAVPVPGAHHPDGPDADGNDQVLYAGRFDYIGAYSKSLYGCDDKTASVDPANDSWRNQWRLRGQFSGYCWGAREYGMPIHGFFVRGMGVLTDSVRCGQAIIARPPWMVDQWLAQMQDDVQEMLGQYTALMYPGGPRGHAFPQSFADACADYGGCTYLDLCASQHPEDWYGDYLERRWNPLTREET